MINKINKTRDKLHKVIEKYGINHKKTYRVSKKLDRLVNKYIKKYGIYPEWKCKINILISW